MHTPLTPDADDYTLPPTIVQYVMRGEDGRDYCCPNLALLLEMLDDDFADVAEPRIDKRDVTIRWDTLHTFEDVAASEPEIESHLAVTLPTLLPGEQILAFEQGAWTLIDATHWWVATDLEEAIFGLEEGSPLFLVIVTGADAVGQEITIDDVRRVLWDDVIYHQRAVENLADDMLSIYTRGRAPREQS